MAHRPILYHYTSLEGLLGIVHNRCIHASSIYSFNDRLEHFWFRNLAIERLKSFTEEQLTSAHKDLRDELEKQLREDIYCFCLSSEWDSLGQWRSYASDGCGVAIGFDLSFIDECSDLLRLLKCNYSRETHEIYIGEWLDKMTTHQPSDHNRETISGLNQFAISNYATYCKNPKFAEENEWRIVYRTDMPKKGDSEARGSIVRGPFQRVRGSFVIPYFKIALINFEERAAIKELVFGPKNPFSDNEGPIRDMLEANLFTNVTFRTSEASYR